MKIKLIGILFALLGALQPAFAAKQIRYTINESWQFIKGNNIDKLDLIAQYGEYQAVKVKSEVTVAEDGLIVVDFKKWVSEPVLNAIEIHKKF